MHCSHFTGEDLAICPRSHTGASDFLDLCSPPYPQNRTGSQSPPSVKVVKFAAWRLGAGGACAAVSPTFTAATQGCLCNKGSLGWSVGTGERPRAEMGELAGTSVHSLRLLQMYQVALCKSLCCQGQPFRAATGPTLLR